MTSSAIVPYPIKPIAALPTNSVLAQALLTSVNEYSEQLRGRRIWLACSGGRGSLALAALCVQLYHQGQLPFLPQLLHVDHNMQAGSGLWALHVEKWAQAQLLPCTVLQAKVKGVDEQAARLARYQVMLGHINQGDVLLLAHHADDQAETVLMRLMQGAGVKGLSAMQAWREQSQGLQHNVLWRPWLTVRRATISSYAKQLQLPYINDPTNINGDNLRSSLRRDIMPLLTSHNPNVIENIARSAQLLNDAQATVNTQAVQDWQYTSIETLDYPAAQRVLDIDKLQALPLYRQRQLLHFWLAQDEPLPPTKQLIDDVHTLIQRNDNNHQTQLEWYAKNQHYSVRRYRQNLYRLSYAWLDWLSLPLVSQELLLSKNSQKVTINLRTNPADLANDYAWQLSIDTTELMSLFIDNADELLLKITPLAPQQKIKTPLSNRAQSGKKLYQTLALPVWLRNSLLIVSAVMTNSSFSSDSISDSIDKEIPLLLLSPFEHWSLITLNSPLKLSDNNQTFSNAINRVFNNYLQC